MWKGLMPRIKYNSDIKYIMHTLVNIRLDLFMIKATSALPTILWSFLWLMEETMVDRENHVSNIGAMKDVE